MADEDQVVDQEVDTAEPEVEQDSAPSVRQSIEQSVKSLETGDKTEKADKPVKPKSGADKDKQATAKGTEQKKVTNGTTPPSADTTPQASIAPAGWSKEAKDAWSALSPVVQAAVTKREQDIQNGVNQLKQRFEPIEQVLAKLDPIFQKRSGGNRQQGFTNLANWAMALEQNPAHALVMLARSYGFNIGPNQVVPQQGQQPQPQFNQAVGQAINPLQQKLSALEQRLQEREQSASDAQVASWSKDKPHFEAVRHQMGELLKAAATSGNMDGYIDASGAPDLDRLYEAAVWANPQTRALAQAEADEVKRKETQAQRDKAKRAGVSIRTSAPGGPKPKAPPGKAPTARESIMDAIAQHTGRS